MKLTPDSINQLDTLLQSALIAGLDRLVIAEGKIRGIDKKQSVVIVTTDNVPDLDGKQMGVTRIAELSARMSLVKSQGTLNIEVTVADNDADVKILDLSSGKTKAQFRAASVEAVKAVPKSISDTLVWEVKVNASVLGTLNQAISAMGSENVTLASRDGKVVSIELVDGNKDVFSTDIDDEAVWVGDGAADTSFCQKYPAKTLMSLLKEVTKAGSSATLKIGQKGILSLKMNGFDFFVIPPQ